MRGRIAGRKTAAQREVAAQPRVTSSALNRLIGVDAQTRVVPGETKPECPFPNQIEIAWSASLVLVVLVLLANIAAQVWTLRRSKR